MAHTSGRARQARRVRAVERGESLTGPPRRRKTRMRRVLRERRRQAGFGRLGGQRLHPIGGRMQDGVAVKSAGGLGRAHHVGRMGDVQLVGP